MCARRIASLLAALVLTVGLTAVAQEYEITRSTIDGGGVMRSAGGEFELSGTIGQPDAGTMTGGAFELNGGFWFPLAAGDCDEDGLVQLLDVDEFNACLNGPDGAPPDGDCRCFDVNRDSVVDLGDFHIVQSVYTGS
jgi:hypothetical protein